MVVYSAIMCWLIFNELIVLAFLRERLQRLPQSAPTEPIASASP